MTTYFSFVPQQTLAPSGPPYQFQPTLDGTVYLATVKWNEFGQRWYVALTTMNGQPIFNQALVGSDATIPIQSISWANGQVTVVCAFPHTFRIGDTGEITVNGCLPIDYNGVVEATALDALTLLYPLPDAPTDATALGMVSYDINLAGGYFQTTTMVFRQGTQQFELTDPTQ